MSTDALNAPPGDGGNGTTDGPPQNIQPSPATMDNMSEITDRSRAAINNNTTQNEALDIGLPKTPPFPVVENLAGDLFEDGYDSDGVRGPFYDAIEEEGPLVVNEEEVGGEESNGESGNMVANSPDDRQTVAILAIDDVTNLKVNELKDELRKRGLGSFKGKKAELQQKLKEAIENNVPLMTNLSPEVMDNLADDVFAPGSYWKLVDNEGEGVEEVEELQDLIEGEQFRAPTIPEGEVSANSAKKVNYTELNFDRPPFVSTPLLPKLDSVGRLMKDTSTGEQLYEKRPTEDTVPNIKYLHDNDINLESHPAEWFNLLFPRKRKKNSKCSVEDITSWTNLKISIAARSGGMYSDCMDFSAEEIMKHLGLYVLNGLSPSPQVEMKFKSQGEDKVNGNDFAYKAFFGVNPIKRHKEFKCFLASVDPRYATPSKKTHPNWKIDPMLKQVMAASKNAIILGKNISVDEQTIRMQGQHSDKLRITYKREGDGFQCDVICADGYTFSFYFRNQPAPKKWLDKGLSPLHSRVMALYDQLETDNHVCGMDNLYMSTKLCFMSRLHPRNISIHGVTRMSGRGIPKCVEQEIETRKNQLEKVRGTVKLATLQGDSKCPGFVALSFYDSKPVYFLSTACDTIKWIKKERKVWHKGLQRKVPVPFHRLNVIEYYNHNMGNVDLADQLRGVYRFDHWMRKRKWWWSIFFWSYQVLLTNAYVLYCKYHSLHKSSPMTHYEFQKQVAIAWLDPVDHPVWNRKKRSKRSHSAMVSQGSSASTRKSNSADVVPTRRTRRSIYFGPAATNDSPSTTESESSTRATTRTMSAAEADAATKQPKRNKRVNAKNLHPTTGAHKMRLDHHSMHLPIVCSKPDSVCQLHHWATGKRYKKALCVCSKCNVTLCLKCYSKFHLVEDIVGMKDSLAVEYGVDGCT